MAGMDDCVDDISGATGGRRSRQEIEDELQGMIDRAGERQQGGEGPHEALGRAAQEMLEEEALRKTLAERAIRMDAMKTAARHRFFDTTRAAIRQMSPRLAKQAARLALEAKLVGVNLPFMKNRMSVDAQYVAYRKEWVGGFERDLVAQGLDKVFASRAIEDHWTNELFELNRGSSGNPGVTGDKQALAIAKTIQKWQKISMVALNREGAWVRSYSGYITRQSHDADAIRRAGPVQWAADIMADPDFDAKRTFGTTDRQRIADALHQMWTPMKDGNHFDYGKPVDEPLYPNVARQASDIREIHWKTGAGWRRYNEKYGVGNPTHTVVTAISTAARRVALMKEFGTKPREAYDQDKAWLKATLQAESRGRTGKLAALQAQIDQSEPETLAKNIAKAEQMRDARTTRISEIEKSQAADAAAHAAEHERLTAENEVRRKALAELEARRGPEEEAGLAAEIRRTTAEIDKADAAIARAEDLARRRNDNAEKMKAALAQERDAHAAQVEEMRKIEAGGPALREEISKELEDLRAEIDRNKGEFGDFDNWTRQALDSRFAQIDGSSQRPVNRTWANTAAGWMSTQRMSKLGRVALTHFASLPTKSMEARYWGIPFSERYASLIRGLSRGAEGSDKRAALDATLVAFETRLGHMMNMYDVADAPAGWLTRWESTFFKLTGVSSVVDNQRGDAEAMFAAHVGSKRGLPWAEIGRKEQRVLQGFGIGEAEWKAFNQVEWTKLGKRTYLFPPDIRNLTDDQVRAYIAEARPGGLVTAGADQIAQVREDLAMAIATAYSDRAGFAIPMPDARTRAVMFGKNFEPGTGLNTALKLIYQFKMWPATMIMRAWGREIHGTRGDGALDRIAGLTEAAVGALVFGVAAESVRSLIQGQNPLYDLQHNPIGAILKGGQRSGFGSLVGDYLLGQFDRHGFSAVASLAGPTVSQLDTLMDLLHAGGETEKGTFSGPAMRQRGADLIRMARDNTPFMSLAATGWATNYLIWHRLQEWINPGYLARSEQRQKQQRGIQYWLSPSKFDRWETGKAPLSDAVRNPLQ